MMQRDLVCFPVLNLLTISGSMMNGRDIEMKSVDPPSRAEAMSVSSCSPPTVMTGMDTARLIVFAASRL